MSNVTLDNDALATEEMLKMFEGIDIDETLESTDVVDELTLNNSLDSNKLDLADHKLEMLETLDELPEIDQENMSEADILEVAELEDTDALIQALDAIEQNDELDGISFDELAEIDQTADDDQNHDDTMPIAEPTQVDNVALASLDADTNDMAETKMAEIDPTPVASAQADETLSSQPTVNAANNLVETNPIAEHLHLVVANAIQALQDWMQLRQEGEAKSPQQSLAQLDVLLDTVTNQQQQLAEQLANSPHKQLAQISSALGVTLATPQTLGWSDEDWRVKAQQVADKTDDISQRNAQIRYELERL